MRREKRSVQPDAAAVENQLVKLAYRPGRSIKSACMSSSYAPKNMQSKNPGHHREATATIESHLMLDSKFTKTPAGVISFPPAQTQKRPFSSASQIREGTNSTKTSHLKMSTGGVGAQSRSRRSRQLFQGLKYGQAAAMSCSLTQSQALNNYKNKITDFGGLTLLERQHNFKDYNPIDQSKEELHEASRNYVAITEPAEADYQCSANQIRIASSKNNRVMFPSQFASAKSGLMGFEERSVGKRPGGAVKILRGQSKSEVGQHREPLPAGSLWHTRMFSKTKVYLNEADNCTDGITLPISYFDLMPKKEIETMLALYEMRQKKNKDPSSSTGLLVSVNTIPTHFNIDSNNLHKNLKNDLIDQLTNQNHCCEGESNSVLKRWTTLVHVSKIDFARSSDDDTVTLPEWVFPSLQIQLGEPVVVSLDRQLTDLQSTLNDNYLLKYIQLEPLQTNYLEMGMQDKRNQECDKSVKDDTKDPEQSRYKDSHDSIRLGVQQALKGYRILRPDRVLKFFTNNKAYEFQIRGLNDDQQAFYINSQNQKLEIELIMNDLLTQTPGKNASFARGNSISTKTKRGSNKPEKQQSAGIDLDLILQERGLDIFYMEGVINECRGLSQSPLQKQERKETTDTVQPEPSKPEDTGSSERGEIKVGPEVTLKTTAKTGAKLKNMLHDIDSSDQSRRDPAPSSPKTKSNEDLRLRLLQSQPNSTPRIRENHSDDANTPSPSRPSRSRRGIAKTQTNTLADHAKNPHQPSDYGLLTSPGLSPEIQSPAPMIHQVMNFTDGLSFQYGQLAKDQALDGHVLVTDQENSTHRTKTQVFRHPGEQNEPHAISKATEDHLVQRAKPLDSFPELLRKKEKSMQQHNKANAQILDHNNLRSPTKEKQKLDALASRSILSDGPSLNRLAQKQQGAATRDSKDRGNGLGQFEDYLLKQQFKGQFENIDQAQLRASLSQAGENDDEKCELSASSQGLRALLETAMLPALPADGEAEGVRDSALGRNGDSPHRRRELRASLALAPTAAKVRPDKKAPLAVGAPFGKDNICLKVNNMEVFDGLQQSAHTRAPVEKHNTELKTSFQTLGDVLNSAAFGRRRASEGSVTDFLTQTISKEKEAAAKRAAPSGMPASRAAAVGRSHESERQFQTIIRNPTDFASTPNGDFSVFVVPKDFRIKTKKKVVAAQAPTPLRKIATVDYPTMGQEMEALRASSTLDGGGVALDESVMRKWASGSRSLHGQTFLRAQQHRGQKSGTLHNYEHNDASKRIETSLFTRGGMQPLFSPTLAIAEVQPKKPAGGVQLAPTIYAAVAPEAEFTPDEKKMFQDLHKMIMEEQYSRSQESVLGQGPIFQQQAKQGAEAYHRDRETFGHNGGEDGTQDLTKQGGDESEVPSLKPSPSLKTHERTARRLEEAGPATNDKGSNKVTDYSEITARQKPGSPDGAEVEGDRTKSGLPTPRSGGKLGAEIELKAEVTVKPKHVVELDINPNAPLTPGSERSQNSISAIGQVIFSKKHVHGSPKKGTPDKRQGRITSGNTIAEKAPTTPGSQANRPGDPRFRSPRPQGFNQRTFQLQMGGTGHDWDGLATTQKLVKGVSTKTRIELPNADLGSALKQSEPMSPATQLLPPSRPSEKKGPDDELDEEVSQDGRGKPKLTGAAALAATKYKIELRPANWRQITQAIKEKAKRYRHAGAPPSNWESIKANFAKLQGGQTSETQKYSVYGSNLEASQRAGAVRPGLPYTARSLRQRARGLKTLCAGEINEYNHHSASIPQGCKGVGKARHARGRSKNSASQATTRGVGGNLNKGFSFVSPAVPLSGVSIALRAYPHSLFRNELQGGLSPGGHYYENHDLLRLNHDYGLWNQQEAAQAADTRAGSAQRAGDVETHLGPAQPRWSGHSRGDRVEAQTNILSNQTLGLAYQIGDSQLEQRSQ